MPKRIEALLRTILLPWRYHFFGSFAIVATLAAVITLRVSNRSDFANSELHRDVMDRWGAPIGQPAPSLRFVESGSVFHTLGSLPLDSQHVEVDAVMSYRKRGLVYFSGFEFGFRGAYEVENREGHPIDLAFVFPIDLERNKVLLSDLAFTVDGAPAPIDLGRDGALRWTGRVAPTERRAFAISYRGRGLDSFVYKLDPALPVRDFRLAMRVKGGDNFDYPEGVVSAQEASVSDDGIALTWQYASLESGIPVGALVPSEKSFDDLLVTMVGRSTLSFLPFFVGLVAVVAYHGRRLSLLETYLLAAAYGFFFVLTAYLGAYLSFYLACLIAASVVALLVTGYMRAVVNPGVVRPLLFVLSGSLFVPAVAVLLVGHTGLVYTLELLVLLVVTMALSTRTWFQRLIEDLTRNERTEEAQHVG